MRKGWQKLVRLLTGFTPGKRKELERRFAVAEQTKVEACADFSETCQMNSAYTENLLREQQKSQLAVKKQESRVLSRA